MLHVCMCMDSNMVSKSHRIWYEGAQVFTHTHISVHFEAIFRIAFLKCSLNLFLLIFYVMKSDMSNIKELTKMYIIFLGGIKNEAKG